MSLEADLIDKYKAIFNGRLWFDTMPEGVSNITDVFCVISFVGGRDRWYVDNTLPDMQNARVQFTVWGARREEVNAAADALRKAVAESNTVDFITSPFGAKVSDWNDILKLRGARQDFGFWFKDPLAAAP